jgi:hypothetical protein
LINKKKAEMLGDAPKDGEAAKKKPKPKPAKEEKKVEEVK